MQMIFPPLLTYCPLYCTMSLCGGGHLGRGRFRASSKKIVSSGVVISLSQISRSFQAISLFTLQIYRFEAVGKGVPSPRKGTAFFHDSKCKSFSLIKCINVLYNTKHSLAFLSSFTFMHAYGQTNRMFLYVRSSLGQAQKYTTSHDQKHVVALPCLSTVTTNYRKHYGEILLYPTVHLLSVDLLRNVKFCIKLYCI